MHRYLLGGLLLLLTGCSTLNANNMTILNGLWTPSDDSVKESMRVGEVKSASDAQLSGIDASEQQMKEALELVLTEYSLKAPEGKETYLVDASIDISTSGIPDITASCDGHYTITNRQTNRQKALQINSVYTAKLSTSDLWKGTGAVMLSGILQIKGTDGDVATEVAKAAFEASGGAGVRTSRGLEDGLNEEQLAYLERIGYAKRNTPLTSLDGTKRVANSMEGCVRSNFAKLINEIASEQSLP